MKTGYYNERYLVLSDGSWKRYIEQEAMTYDEAVEDLLDNGIETYSCTIERSLQGAKILDLSGDYLEAVKDMSQIEKDERSYKNWR